MVVKQVDSSVHPKLPWCVLKYLEKQWTISMEICQKSTFRSSGMKVFWILASYMSTSPSHSQCKFRQSWDINDDGTTNILINTHLLYYAWGREISSPGRLVTDNTELMESAIVAILYLAGFRAKRGGFTQQMIMKDGPTFRN